MTAAYDTALRTIADSYDAEVARRGGKSLSRIATIVVSSGAFFNRLRDGKTFSVTNLEKFAAWFRVPANWPDRTIPHVAATALISIGRPPLPSYTMPHSYRTGEASVDCDLRTIPQPSDAA